MKLEILNLNISQSRTSIFLDWIDQILEASNKEKSYYGIS